MLLISHQHCLLALATAIDQYKLLDISVDDFPGDAPDKCARCLKLHHLPGMRDMAGDVCGSWSTKGVEGITNLFIREGLTTVAEEHSGMEAVYPPPRLCTNGVMIALSGLVRGRSCGRTCWWR